MKEHTVLKFSVSFGVSKQYRETVQSAVCSLQCAVREVLLDRKSGSGRGMFNSI